MFKIILRSLILIGIIALLAAGLYALGNSAWGQSILTGNGGFQAGTAAGNRTAPPQGQGQGFSSGAEWGGDDHSSFSLERGLPELVKTAGILLAGAGLIALMEGLIARRMLQRMPSG